MYLFIEKKFIYKWTCKVQTHAVQVSTVVVFFCLNIYNLDIFLTILMGVFVSPQVILQTTPGKPHCSTETGPATYMVIQGTEANITNKKFLWMGNG